MTTATNTPTVRVTEHNLDPHTGKVESTDRTHWDKAKDFVAGLVGLDFPETVGNPDVTEAGFNPNSLLPGPMVVEGCTKGVGGGSVGYMGVEGCTKGAGGGSVGPMHYGNSSRLPRTIAALKEAGIKPKSALQKQEGGTHYKDMVIQPIEYITANKIGFAEGTVIQYVSRWKAKNGIADLKKALHTLELLIELETAKEKANG